MIYLYWWIAIGIVTLIVVLGAHLLTKKKESDSLRDLLDAANPERTKFSYRLLNNIVAPALGSVVIVIAWPIAIYMKAKEIFLRRNGGSSDSERAFAVESKHLLERLSVKEIEQREIVDDPLNAVPTLPFGHLNGAWRELLMGLSESDELWSFCAEWQTSGGRKELRAGYVAVQNGIPGNYLMTDWRELYVEADVNPAGSFTIKTSLATSTPRIRGANSNEEPKMQWMISINELGAQQARILEDVSTDTSRTHWIAGYAGTGKTVVITHAIERLVARTRNASICFLTYTHALKDLVRSGLSEKASSRVTIETIDTFSASGEHYDYILVDEIQDVTESAINKIFARAEHVIAAGDPDQSIYLGRVDPSSLRQLLGGARKHTLKHIQRLSLKTFQMATSILPEAEIVKGAEVKGEGNNGRLIKATSRKDEFLKVYAEAVRVSAIEQPSAILFPMHDQIHQFASVIADANGWGRPPEREKRGRITSYEAFNEFFSMRKAPLRFLGSNNGSLPESDENKLVYLMTYHSAKGLDFNNVFLPDLTVDVKLDAKWRHLSKEENERRHFFVAITRSKENIYFSYHGQRHPLLDQLPEECLEDFVAPRTTFRRSA